MMLDRSTKNLIDQIDPEQQEAQIRKLNDELDLRIEEMFGLKMGTFDTSQHDLSL
jgi:hypothetical protein